ncbi:hypothetical protein GSI_11807 [Ganoderma sinense ZZ0214-1]|uniref:Uncharacterized protein n=1 Tax=Ganoderma sinense ZZ0214-1 TaxID=1077348 RepID=A0A2G8RX11_9APHY|nr:hypothetical protein GSI_11807 [Ganoderma sinense ZZ0214-1]
MLLKFFTSFTILTAICVPYISATIVSLLVPGDLVDDGLPITANPIGTDSTGHTTWVLAVGAPSGTFTASETGATPQADTLVAGATDMHIIETSADGTAVQTGREDCVFATPTASGGAPIASCVIQVQNGQSTATLAFTEPVSFLPVQVADKTSGSSSPAPTQTGKGGNGAGRMGFMGVGELAVLGLMNVLLSVVL